MMRRQMRQRFASILVAVGGIFVLLIGSSKVDSFSASLSAKSSTTTSTTNVRKKNAADIDKNMAKDGPSSQMTRSSQSKHHSSSSFSLREYQTQVAAPLVSSFQPSVFRPLPLLANPHVQTIVATVFRHIPRVKYFCNLGDTLRGLLLPSENIHNDNDKQFWNYRQRIDTPDGDFFHVDYKLHHSFDKQQHDTDNAVPTSSETNQRGMVVMCHGLESNSDSNLSRDMTQAYFDLGLDVACLNFRGCCGNVNDLLGGYHLGFTDDLLLFLEERRRMHEDDDATSSPTTTTTTTAKPPIFLSGFSLGANVILKALGELKLEAVTKYNIQGATALCVPYDAERNAPFLGRPGFNQWVYCGNLLKTLRKRAQFQLELHCDGDKDTDKFDYAGVMAAKTITDFDEAFVAPVYGFESAIDYYRKTSCIGFLESIAVPTYILTARDDPFMDPSLLPTELTLEGGGRGPIKMVATDYGGHCGYIFHQVESPDDIRDTSWSSTEMARFLKHLLLRPKSRQEDE